MTPRTPAAPLLDRGQVITHKNVKYALSARDTFEAEVEPAEVFEVDTELNIGGHLITHPDDRLTEADINVPYGNPATGPPRPDRASPLNPDGQPARHVHLQDRQALPARAPPLTRH
ncbi:hypothetical protein [Streptomyces sp. AP-93]|uniref:hypothetical protein n=1 Tax=Streptomyces sp. AP-93 TaxID=2929048 RepID=UPI001FAFFE23|nr:hypothetical protein [Streptomyces sp. AP-93]MCJ0868600.1 hypothetical protein [Streptomyces sp. AP-93]